MSELVWHQVDPYYITDESLLFTISKYKFGARYTAWSKKKRKVERGRGKRKGLVLTVDNGSLGNFDDLGEAKAACQEYKDGA